MADIPERDWKRMKSLEARALNDACARTLDKVSILVKPRNGRNHEIYLALWKLLREESDEIALLFDDLKRSRALSNLAAWRLYGLISESEMALFTEETQDRVKVINEFEDEFQR